MRTVRKAKNSWSEPVITAAGDSESQAGWERNTAFVNFPRACGARQRDLKELAVHLFGSWRVLDTFNFPEFNRVCFGGERNSFNGGEREKQLQCTPGARLGRVRSQKHELLRQPTASAPVASPT